MNNHKQNHDYKAMEPAKKKNIFGEKNKDLINKQKTKEKLSKKYKKNGISAWKL